MNIHLDTSFLIRSLLPKTSESALLDRWITGGENVGISSVAWCEFLCGPVSPEAIPMAILILGPPISFLPEDATVAATLFNTTGRRRGSLLDCMIAAIALRSGASIATGNLEDFRRFGGNGIALATP